MKACEDAGYRVPDDISIVAMDNTEYCLCTTPPLTSVDMLQGQVGEEAARFVLDRIVNKRAYQKNMAFSPVLVERGSVKKCESALCSARSPSQFPRGNRPVLPARTPCLPRGNIQDKKVKYDLLNRT